MTGIWSRCTDFPHGGRPSFSGTVPIHPGSIELMEIDMNTTLSGASEPQNMSIYAGQAVGNYSARTNATTLSIVAPAPWPT